MSSADSSTGVLSENRSLLLAVGAGVLLLLLLVLLGVSGAAGVVGFLGFAVYAVVWLAIVAFVLWLFYRLVVAVERIAHAQQRIAAAQNPPGGSTATRTAAESTEESDGATGHEATGGDANTESE